ncbi:MAG TPA: endonuclease [Phycisphaerae bacterium]|nr:endonuclease [Phycisphaerae bacterium]
MSSAVFHDSDVVRTRPASLCTKLLVLTLGVVLGANRSVAQPPPGYYDSVDATNAATLRATLHPVIDDHTRFPYTSTATDTWNILEQADEDPNNASNILDIYKNASYVKVGAGNSFYEREHTWPNSYGFPNDNSSNYPYTDCHALMLCDGSYNSSRSNKPYRFCDAACTEKVTDANNGQGGGSGVYPGNSNWTSGSFTAGTWETWNGRRGDVARAILYMDLRYEGGTHGITGIPEPDLIVTDNEALIDASNTGANESVAYMGMLAALLVWHTQDPVDAVEQARNDVVFSYQGNRNPFIDHPEWVDCIWNANCGGDTTPPAAPTGLIATAGNGVVDLDWADNGEPDLTGYNVYRGTASGGPYSQINGALVTNSVYSDATVSNGTTYYYVVRAVDTSSNESGNSNEAGATPSGPATPWINEFHYDNNGTDTGEFVEVAGPAGTSLSGWRLIGYNGSGGATYATVSLSGTIPDQQDCLGTLGFAFTGLQNGSPDGIALVDAANAVVQFLSYEGSFTATDGPASGMLSVDVGVSESSTSTVGHSLQLAGTGKQYADFTWQPSQANTQGQPNTGQTFSDPACVDTTPPASPTGLTATGGNAVVNLNWNDNSEPDLAGYNVYRSTTSGGPYSPVNGALVTASAFSDFTVSNGVTYYYVVRAMDGSNNESGNSSQASATPQAGPTTMHVSSIVLSTVNAGGGKVKGRATVTIVNNLGNPVSGVSVNGTFTGSYSQTLSATTNSNGVATLTTSSKITPPVTFTFCVNNVTGGSLTYAPGENLETCDSY